MTTSCLTLLAVVLATFAAQANSTSLACKDVFPVAPAEDALGFLRPCYSAATKKLDDGRIDPALLAQRVANACKAETEAVKNHYGTDGTLGTTAAGTAQTIECWATGVVLWIRKNPGAPIPPPVTRLNLLQRAGSSPVHVISIFQSSIAQVVKIDAPASVVLLFSFEPVKWQLEWSRGKAPARVLAIGGIGKPTVQIPSGEQIEVIATDGNYIRGPLGPRVLLPLERAFPVRDSSTLNREDAASFTQALTGSMPTSYQSVYSAPNSGFSIKSKGRQP